LKLELEVHAKVNRNETVKKRKVMKRYPVIHMKFRRYTTGHSDRLELEREKIEKKAIIRYSIKNLSILRTRSGVKYRGRVFYQPLDGEGFSSHVVEFSTRILGTH